MQSRDDELVPHEVIIGQTELHSCEVSRFFIGPIELLLLRVSVGVALPASAACVLQWRQIVNVRVN